MSPHRLLLLVLAFLTAVASAQADEADCSGQYRTQTQGGWGAHAAGDNPGSYRDAHFNEAFAASPLSNATYLVADDECGEHRQPHAREGGNARQDADSRQ